MKCILKSNLDVLIITVFISLNTVISQNILIEQASFNLGSIQVGEKTELELEFRVDGQSNFIIPPGTIHIQLSFPFNTYTSKITSPPFGGVTQKFDWSLDENNYWNGFNRNSLIANESYFIYLDVFGVSKSDKPETADFHIRAIRNLELFENNSREDDYMQASLEVIENPSNLNVEYVVPANNSIDVSLSTSLEISFDQQIEKNTMGSVSLISPKNNQVIEVYDISDPRLTATGNSLLIDYTLLDYDTEYYILISNGAIKSIAGIEYSGIHNQSIWSFKTEKDASILTCIQESFESNSGYTISNTFDDDSFSFLGRYGVPDFANEARNDIITGWEGGYGVLGQNFTESGHSATQSIVIDDIDISSFLSFSISMSLAALDSEPQYRNYEGDDGIEIYATMDDQATVKIGAFHPNATGSSDLYQDTDGDGIGDGHRLTRALTPFTFSNQLRSGSSLDIGIDFTSDDGFELLAVDNIRVHSADVSACDFISPVYNEVPIYTIQGSGNSADYEGQVVTTTGIISGDFQGANRLNGFFMQDITGDNNDQTSDGIFVRLESGNAFSSINLFEGDQVKVTGFVKENLELTTMDHVLHLEIINVGHQLTPINVVLPEAQEGDLEQVEAMLINIENPMTVTQSTFLGRYGQLSLSSPSDAGIAGRLYKPTNVFPANTIENLNLQNENKRRLLILDDGQDINWLGDNPEPVPFIDPLTNYTIRAGDGVTNLIGVLDQGRINANTTPAIDYRLHPLVDPIFTSNNLRQINSSPSTGDLKVAAFNVLNYFNGNGQGGGFPGARGAHSESEFLRQSAKIVDAIIEINADIFGLIELENDGYGELSAIQHLVNELNAAMGTEVYSFIDLGGPIGTDLIAVGIIYKHSLVSPQGPAAILTSQVNPLFNDQRNRPAVAQSFAQISNSEKLTVVVNHLKSKGSGCAGDGDTGDGQGNCNETRTNAAQAIAEWIETDPTGSNDPDFLIIGDLNAYAKEDPLIKLASYGYTNVADALDIEDQYSYVFDGEAGMLDHVLSSSELSNKIQDISIWHINTDEPSLFDYDEGFNPDGFYSIDPFRSSDHDPIIISLNLSHCVDHLDITTNTALDGQSIHSKSKLTLESSSHITGPGSLQYTSQNITLKNGFKIQTGTVFRVDIGACR